MLTLCASSCIYFSDISCLIIVFLLEGRSFLLHITLTIVSIEDLTDYQVTIQSTDSSILTTLLPRATPFNISICIINYRSHSLLKTLLNLLPTRKLCSFHSTVGFVVDPECLILFVLDAPSYRKLPWSQLLSEMAFGLVASELKLMPITHLSLRI
jgi:hypothetical protein